MWSWTARGLKCAVIWPQAPAYRSEPPMTATWPAVVRRRRCPGWRNASGERTLAQPGAQYAPGVRTEFEGFCVEFESFNPTTHIVRVRSAVGTFSATWMGNEPKCGDQSSVEFSTEPTAVWGVDVTEASPDEPDAILEDAEGWTFVGRVLGVEPGVLHYADGGRLIPAHDLETGVFYLRIGESVVMLDADGLPADAAGRRVRVRQTRVELFPQ